jgi:hypothetical protein
MGGTLTNSTIFKYNHKHAQVLSQILSNEMVHLCLVCASVTNNRHQRITIKPPVTRRATSNYFAQLCFKSN